MPHGVLFRGGKEQDIRKKIIEADRLDAVIGLAPNLFYGTGIPACVLVLRGTGPRPADRRGKVLFINADREFTAGRAQNYLGGSTSRRSSPPTGVRGRPGFARVVAVDELARERLQPQHPPLRRQHPSTRTAGRPRPPARRHARGGDRAQAAKFAAYGIDVAELFVPPNVPGTTTSPRSGWESVADEIPAMTAAKRGTS